MPLLNGLEATRQLRKTIPATKVLMLYAHNDDAYVANAIAAWASGFLRKQTSAHDVCRAIREAHQGKTYFIPTFSKRFDRPHPPLLGHTRMSGDKIVQITSREVEVLQLIAEGRANKEIAGELGIGMKTVEKHREHLMQKLDIHAAA